MKKPYLFLLRVINTLGCVADYVFVEADTRAINMLTSPVSAFGGRMYVWFGFCWIADQRQRIAVASSWFFFFASSCQYLTHQLHPANIAFLYVTQQNYSARQYLAENVSSCRVRYIRVGVYYCKIRYLLNL